jgi:hypothetical protein
MSATRRSPTGAAVDSRGRHRAVTTPILPTLLAPGEPPPRSARASVAAPAISRAAATARRDEQKACCKVCAPRPSVRGQRAAPPRPMPPRPAADNGCPRESQAPPPASSARARARPLRRSRPVSVLHYGLEVRGGGDARIGPARPAAPSGRAGPRARRASPRWAASRPGRPGPPMARGAEPVREVSGLPAPPPHPSPLPLWRRRRGGPGRPAPEEASPVGGPHAARPTPPGLDSRPAETPGPGPCVGA